MKLLNSLKEWKKTYKVIEFPSNSQGNLLERLVFFQKGYDIDPLIEVWKEITQNTYLELPHPELKDISSRAVNSWYIGLNNFIFFTDKKNMHPWLMVQTTNFIDLIISTEFIYTTSRSNNHTVYPQISKLASLDKANLNYGDYKIGFHVHHPRPYHYFYDQLKYVFQYINVPGHRNTPIIWNGFFHPEGIEENTNNRGFVYISPTIGGNNFFPASKNPTVKHLNEEMEKNIREQTSPQVTQQKLANLVIWFGITAQKRSWIQQVESLHSIVCKLNSHFRKITVYIDGMTAPENKKITSYSDLSVVAQIEKTLNGICNIKSIVDLDYKSKILIGNKVDIFVANAGTGSLVPMRFCRKPGVLHSSTKFASLTPPEGTLVKKTHKRHTIDLDLENKGRNDGLSYHIPWQHIYNLLIEILNKDYEISLEKIHVPPVKTLHKEWIKKNKNKIDNVALMSNFKLSIPPQAKENLTVSLISEAFRKIGDINLADRLNSESTKLLKLGIKVKAHHTEADILREAATSFDKLGDIDLAITLMEKALAIRPSGLVIYDKLHKLYERKEAKKND